LIKQTMLLLVFTLCLAVSGCSASEEGGNAQMESSKVRQPAVAGSFYPGNQKALRETVTSMLEKAGPSRVTGRIVGLVAPHAGYVYSGQVAAWAYRAVEGTQYDAVVVVAPSHHVYFAGSSIFRDGSYMTPLGAIETATDIADAIAAADPSVGSRADAHTQEHSLEVQLPFLQVALPRLRLVPIVMGDQSLAASRRLAKAIAAGVRGKNVLLVASTDLSHYHNYAQAVSMDLVVMDHIEKYDPEGLLNDLDRERCEACGGGPVAAVMLAARELGAVRAVVLNHANSGDVTGDKSAVVGYMAAALVAEANPGEGGSGSTKVDDARPGVDLGLSDNDKRDLLRIARGSIEAAVAGKPAPDLEVTSPKLRDEMGAFVTLTERGELRGCIGNIVGTQPLYRTVAGMAVAAATEDPRFPPVGADELPKLGIEISVLTPLRTITDPEEIQVGRDGIYLEKGRYRGLLLPQVATEYGWDRYQFLDHTCIKANLPKGSWREGATIQIFSAQIFNEADTLGRPASR
jgi:AmmeMemoRadiSam system protein B/AmmeMemoRadiSam system protein A